MCMPCFFTAFRFCVVDRIKAKNSSLGMGDVGRGTIVHNGKHAKETVILILLAQILRPKWLHTRLGRRGKIVGFGHDHQWTTLGNGEEHAITRDKETFLLSTYNSWGWWDWAILRGATIDNEDGVDGGIGHGDVVGVDWVDARGAWPVKAKVRWERRDRSSYLIILILFFI